MLNWHFAIYNKLDRTMQHVYIYAGAGRFAGGDFEWSSPAPGATHKFMLFLAQNRDEPLQQEALSEIARHGFRDVELAGGRRLLVEALNDPQMRAFHKHYEAALAEGASLVWYP